MRIERKEEREQQHTNAKYVVAGVENSVGEIHQTQPTKRAMLKKQKKEKKEPKVKMGKKSNSTNRGKM